MDDKILREEREFTAKVQGLLLAIIENAQKLSGEHSESIHAILTDAWEELRLRPTAISPEEMDALATDIERYKARKRFAEELAENSHRMLMKPYFGRVDFRENGADTAEDIRIGLHGLTDEKGNLLVYDWRAPISSLYYDAMPGSVSYVCPEGTISGEMTLKRQYAMERGVLKYYVDTALNIDDSMLLDILSGASSRHMRQIVSSIQEEQNRAIRSDAGKVVSVVGSAGSGKTSVAMHRAAYLMYSRRDELTANSIRIMSPSTAFSEYISTVLPELGEENIDAKTLHDLVESVLGHIVEHPVTQLGRLLDDPTGLRTKSVALKSGSAFFEKLKQAAEAFEKDGPHFTDLVENGNVVLKGAELKAMYAREQRRLTPSQRLLRMRASLETMLTDRERVLRKRFEEVYSVDYRGKELRMYVNMAVSQELQPIRSLIGRLMTADCTEIYRSVLADAPMELREAYDENRAAGLTWWEDAVGEAYLRVRLGFAEPDKSIFHLLVDEAQDHSDTALGLLGVYHPRAKVTLLGDPMQRTCPGMPECEPANWGKCFGVEDAPLYRLSRCYRSALPIVELCASFMPDRQYLDPIQRDGDAPVIARYSDELLRSELKRYDDAGHKSVAVITRTQSEANRISDKLTNVFRLDGGEADLQYEKDDNVVACYHLTKGMEFDAAIVVWPDVPMDDGERRRLYTSCSRALHAVTLLTEGSLADSLMK